MRILETTIPDIHTGNIDKSKLRLAEKIIKNVYPLFDEVYSDKLSLLVRSKKELKVKRQKVLDAKNVLEQYINEFNRRKKAKKLLEKISKLVSLGLTSDGTSKNEMVVLLKIVDKLPNDKLDEHLNKTSRIITKRFGS
jgi:hypothetical protein